MGSHYHVDLDSIVASFPKKVQVPALLSDLAGFVAKQRRGTLGFDAMQGEPLDENMLDDDEATRIARLTLGLFLSLADGSRLALWKHDDKSDPAVVLVESEGQHKTLAPSLQAFLLSWTRGKTGVEDLDDEESGAGREALARWLRERGVEAPKAKPPKTKLPSLSAYFTACRREAKAARAAAAKAQGPRARRVKPTLGAPTAASVVDLVPRALALLEKPITEPDVSAFFAELGLDVMGISKPDVLRTLVLPDLGLEFEIDWPWAGGKSKRLEAAFPRAIRDEMERAKSRMFKEIEVFPEGYKTPNLGMRGYVTFKAFPGKLPDGVLLTDTRAKVIGKLGAPTEIRSNTLYWEDDINHRRLFVSFGTGKYFPKGKIEGMRWQVR